jgi:hypothetical protein
MLKSLRWRLQIWHALILTCVIAGFGAALYIQIRRATLDDIDEELLSGARVLEATLPCHLHRVFGLDHLAIRKTVVDHAKAICLQKILILLLNRSMRPSEKGNVVA